MSRVYFHSPSGDAVVRGAERHHAAHIVDKIGLSLLDPGSYGGRPRLMAALRPPASYEMRPHTDDFAIFLRVSGSEHEFETKDGERSGVWSVLLNTAMRVGSRPVKLMARLHAQCEIHAWVDGSNRNWLAGIIELGLRDGVMRKEMGWEGVIELLQSRSDEPVVTSYSVTEQFPNRTIAAWDPPLNEAGEPDEDAYYELDGAVRWNAAMDGLRKLDGGLEIKPDDFDTYFFGSGLSALTIFDHLPEQKETV